MTRTPIHQSVTIMVETIGEMAETLSEIGTQMPNVPTSTSAMTTGKSFDIDYSIVGGNFFEIFRWRIKDVGGIVLFVREHPCIT